MHAISTDDSKKYNGIDVMKFLCAILVVAIHIPPIYTFVGNELSFFEKGINLVIQRFLGGVAVPFYFVCSGFFLFKKMPQDALDVNRVKNYCFKLLRLLGMWSILLFVGNKEHLWYLSATVVAVVFLSVCLYFHIDLKHLIVIACCLYTIGLLGDAYFQLIEPFTREGVFKHLYSAYCRCIETTRNGVFMGYIFVLIGFVFSQEKIKLKKWMSLVGLIISSLFLFAEVFFLYYYDMVTSHNMSVFVLPTVFFLFALVSSLSLKDRPIYTKLRIVGTLVYFLHFLIYGFVSLIITAFYEFYEINIAPLPFLLSLVITLLVSFGIEWLSNKEKFKWINWFLA